MMVRLRRLVPLLGLAMLWQSGALACASVPEATKIADADVVVDGTATCPIEKGRCRLRAAEVVKADRLRRDVAETYVLRYDPEAVDRWRRQFEETGVLYMCSVPWEPGSPRVEGRFYLKRVRGGYEPRQDSARGEEAEE